MLKLEKVSKYYYSNGVSCLGLYNINLELHKGEIVAITGESGSGKTTLLNVIAKIDSFDSGEIYFNGEATSYYEVEDLDEFRKNKIGFIFQNYQILDSYSVLDNVKLPLLLKGYTNKEATREARLLIRKVGLNKRTYSKGSKLSGGEKQRCVIARALASDCEILACDEPTGNLDSNTAKEIIDLILELAKDKLVLIVTHNLPEVKPYVTRIIKMSDGKIIEDLPNNVSNPLDFSFEETKVDDKSSENSEQTNNNQTKDKKLNNHLIQIAFQNVLYTPFKSIFLTLIFFVISFIYLLMICVIYMSSTYSYFYTDFNNINENYIFAYNEKLEEFTTDEIEKLNKKYDVAYNNYTNQNILEANFIKSSSSERFLYCQTLEDLTLVKGRMPDNDNEFVIAINSLDYDGEYYYLMDYLDKNLLMYDYKKNIDTIDDLFIETNFKLVGICTYESYKESFHIIVGDEKILNYINNFVCDITLKIDDEEYYYTSSYIKDSDKLEIILPEEYKDQKVSLLLANTYVSSDFTISYDKDIYEPEIHIGLNYAQKQKFFAEIYCNPNTIDFTLAKLKNQFPNLSFVIPSKIEQVETLDGILEKLYSLILIIFYSLLLILVFLITYFILSRVYASKAGDYNILRTLGVTKKKMARIVNYEVLITGNIAILLTLGCYFFLINFFSYYFEITHIPFYILLIFFVVIEYFIYAMGRKFNKKLFKFTVAANLKDGGSND